MQVTKQIFGVNAPIENGIEIPFEGESKGRSAFSLELQTDTLIPSEEMLVLVDLKLAKDVGDWTAEHEGELVFTPTTTPSSNKKLVFESPVPHSTAADQKTISQNRLTVQDGSKLQSSILMFPEDNVIGDTIKSHITKDDDRQKSYSRSDESKFSLLQKQETPNDSPPSRLKPAQLQELQTVQKSSYLESTVVTAAFKQARPKDTYFDRPETKVVAKPETKAILKPFIDAPQSANATTKILAKVDSTEESVAKSARVIASEHTFDQAPMRDTNVKLSRAASTQTVPRDIEVQVPDASGKQTLADSKLVIDTGPKGKLVTPTQTAPKQIVAEVFYQPASDKAVVADQQKVKLADPSYQVLAEKSQNAPIQKGVETVDAPIPESKRQRNKASRPDVVRHSDQVEFKPTTHIQSHILSSQPNAQVALWPTSNFVATETPGSNDQALVKEFGVHLPLEAASNRATQPASPSSENSARPVVHQLMHAIKTLQGGSVEIRLSPEELGRVRLSLSPGEGNITVHISAERPETADLIRRNIELFSQSLEQEGFSSPSYSFDGSDAEGSSDQREASNDLIADEPQVDDQTTRTEARLRLLTDGHVDIRI